MTFESCHDACETHLRDPINLSQGGCKLRLAVLQPPALKRGEYACAIVVAHRDDKGKAELRSIVAVELRDATDLCRCKRIEPGARLLRMRGSGQGSCARFLAGELGMGIQQRQLLF